MVQGHNYLRAIYFNMLYNFQEINFIPKLKIRLNCKFKLLNIPENCFYE